MLNDAKIETRINYCGCPESDGGNLKGFTEETPEQR